MLWSKEIRERSSSIELLQKLVDHVTNSWWSGINRSIRLCMCQYEHANAITVVSFMCLLMVLNMLKLRDRTLEIKIKEIEINKLNTGKLISLDAFKSLVMVHEVAAPSQYFPIE